MDPILVAAVANEVAVLCARAQQITGGEIESLLDFSVNHYGVHVAYRCNWGIPYASPLAWDCRETRYRNGAVIRSWRITRGERVLISSDDRQRDDMLPRSSDGLKELAQLLTREEGDADAV